MVIAYDNGGVNDRFRGRVIFPVHTLSGKVVAFGGRVLKKDEKTAKYVNSPESEIYHKSNELYGIYFAKQAIVKEDRCFLVEGYTDVISMHQAGIENVVASSGTALTQGQIRLIHRFTSNITVLYDGDAAGIKAAPARYRPAAGRRDECESGSLCRTAKTPTRLPANIMPASFPNLSNKAKRTLSVSKPVYYWMMRGTDPDQALGADYGYYPYGCHHPR